MQIIDRRLNQKNKSTVNRQRFLRRYRKQIKQAITKQISQRGVTDIDQNESISIPSKDITEPTFRSGQGGVKERVYPGNKEFTKGDRIRRPPPGGQGAGRRASDKGEGEDDFSFEISSDEYMEILFEGLELPNLKKNQLKKLVNYKPIRSGFNTDGTPSNIDIVRSLKGSLARRIASQSPLKAELKQKEEELENLSEEDEKRITLLEDIESLKKRIKSIPYLDTYDLRYKNFDKLPQPTSSAVMFCLMDVSGSMDQQTKDMAKRFFILLYMFLKRTYKDVEVVYIRHHTQAKEVDEQEFFYSQETGGTIVSSALKLMLEIQQDRYPAADWNIYAAQASDGDNWNDDSRICHKLLSEKILKLVRYYTYVEITQREPQNLWYEYLRLQDANSNFAMQKIAEQKDIYPVFREFFQKQSVK
ncbi:YeaH/YhbH family protein [Aliikangiella sp. G2MR2-5]|uniref:YeaH/YhbH family protein n=1 Tax=Aliikangiella sp. G2MR2-5 TaxID=2788943 RepID=UPI0018A9BEEC|nr:YeaH/YhbH family protein [Aliikangiella sp. G2MR2-5]